jgi:hypothetical protein
VTFHGSEKIVDGDSAGAIWIAGWLFTIGRLKLGFGPEALALLIWPYDIGAALNALHP